MKYTIEIEPSGTIVGKVLSYNQELARVYDRSFKDVWLYLVNKGAKKIVIKEKGEEKILDANFIQMRLYVTELDLPWKNETDKICVWAMNKDQADRAFESYIQLEVGNKK